MSIKHNTSQTQEKQSMLLPAQNYLQKKIGKGTSSTRKKSYARPSIIIGRQHTEVITDMKNVLVQDEVQRSTPSIFIRDSRLVEISQNEKDEPSINEFTLITMRLKLASLANFHHISMDMNMRMGRRRDARPPEQEIQGLLNLPVNAWPFPSLRGIIEVPVMRPDGSILDVPGYDKSTKLYYVQQKGMERCKVPICPTSQDVKQALSLIWEVIGEFPYKSAADRANAVALLLTPLLRPAFAGHVPLALLDAPKPGSGKGLLADVAAIIATGRYLTKQPPPTTEAEWDKRITALLMQGCPIICFDNITHTLQSNALDTALTTNPYLGRLLGKSRMVSAPNMATWIVTGNNLKVGGDLGRRCYRIRLDPKTAHPEERSNFLHHPLDEWVHEKRPELIAALLTLARAWYANGQLPAPTITRSDTFTMWAQTIGGILAYAGIPGFLENAKQFQAESDEANLECEQFLHAWQDEIGQKWVTAQQTTSKLQATNAFAEALPEELHTAFKRKPDTFSRTLSKWLMKRKDTRYGEANLYIAVKYNSHQKQNTFHVFAGDEQDSQVAVQQPVKPEEAHHDVQNE